MPQILTDDKIEKGINCLNSKQRGVFNVVHKWNKDYIKYDIFHISFRQEGTGKSHFVKVIYNPISKTLFYYYKDPKKLRILLLKTT